MYVIAKRTDERLLYLSEVFFGSTMDPDAPMPHVACTWVSSPCLFAFDDPAIIYFDDRVSANALLVAMDLLGEETCCCLVFCVED